MVGSSHARRGFEKKTLVGRAFRVLAPEGLSFRRVPPPASVLHVGRGAESDT